MARISLIINHIFFVVDNIIFCRASIGNLNKIQNTLDTYEASSKQRINKHKIEIFFSANTHPFLRENIMNLAGVSFCTNQEKYLDLPKMVEKNRYQNFVLLKIVIELVLVIEKMSFYPKRVKKSC